MQQKLGPEQRIVQNFNDGKMKQKMKKIFKNGGQRSMSKRDLRNIRLSLARIKHATSKKMFEDAGVPDISKATKWRIINDMGKLKKLFITCPLNPRHKVKWLE